MSQDHISEFGAKLHLLLRTGQQLGPLFMVFVDGKGAELMGDGYLPNSRNAKQNDRVAAKTDKQKEKRKNKGKKYKFCFTQFSN